MLRIVSAQEYTLGQPFRRRVIRIGEQWRNALRDALILETVDKILFREQVRRTRLVAHKIPHAVVVLAIGKPSHEAGANLVPGAGSNRNQDGSGGDSSSFHFQLTLQAGFASRKAATPASVARDSAIESLRNVFAPCSSRSVLSPICVSDRSSISRCSMAAR